jgi:hypothetical protein
VNSHFHRFLAITCLVALGGIGCPLAAQQAPQPAQPASPGITAGLANGQGIRGVIGVPYSADEVIETTQTLADGTKITRKQLGKVYRDSQGRRRIEWFKAGAESVGQRDSPQSVEIVDSVAGAIFSLNPRDRTAQKREMRGPTPSTAHQSAATSGNLTPAPPVAPPPTHEDLGTQVIEGVEARGERITTTIPAGAEDNDQPMQITYESWYSTKVRLMLLIVTNDPRSGETVTRFTNLVLDEPPADLFQVPPDYTVQELQPVAKPESPSD